MRSPFTTSCSRSPVAAAGWLRCRRRRGSRGRSEIRVLFAFDPERRAILLVAGDKAGNWTTWYTKNIPIADARYAEHLKGMTR